MLHQVRYATACTKFKYECVQSHDTRFIHLFIHSFVIHPGLRDLFILLTAMFPQSKFPLRITAQAVKTTANKDNKVKVKVKVKGSFRTEPKPQDR
jgi:hypothetical protein